MKGIFNSINLFITIGFRLYLFKNTCTLHAQQNKQNIYILNINSKHVYSVANK